jgi:hypothetical protein
MNLTKEQASRVLNELYRRVCEARDNHTRIEEELSGFPARLKRAKEALDSAARLHDEVRSALEPSNSSPKPFWEKPSPEQQKEAAVRMAVRMFGGDDKW